MIAAAHRIEHLKRECPSPNMDSLMSILQDKLRAVCKEFIEATTAITEKSVCMAQPTMAQASVAAAAENQQLAPPLMMNTPGSHRKCLLCDQEGHFEASCPI